jgi:hypothetical protein
MPLSEIPRADPWPAPGRENPPSPKTRRSESERVRPPCDPSIPSVWTEGNPFTSVKDQSRFVPKAGGTLRNAGLRILKGRRNEAPPFPLPSRALRDLSGKRER